jgi:hypothetical protein
MLSRDSMKGQLYFSSGSSTSARLFRGEFTSVDTSTDSSHSGGQGFSIALISTAS